MDKGRLRFPHSLTHRSKTPSGQRGEVETALSTQPDNLLIDRLCEFEMKRAFELPSLTTAPKIKTVGVLVNRGNVQAIENVGLNF
jgi:hypothetical protein